MCPSIPSEKIGVIIVDHGSRREESNRMLLEIVDAFRQVTEYKAVEPAHMELAEPSIATAYSKCVERGATQIVVHPYFLLPGRHWDRDIPQLAAAAAENHPETSYLVTAPLGAHPLMAQVIAERITACLRHSHGEVEDCPVCLGTDKCAFRGTEN